MTITQTKYYKQLVRNIDSTVRYRLWKDEDKERFYYAKTHEWIWHNINFLPNEVSEITEEEAFLELL